MNTSYGAGVLNDTARFLRRFVVMGLVQADTVALWIAHTHAIEAAESTPYLEITSAEKRSGKSRLGIEVLQLLVRQPLPSMNISDAALFRAVDKLTPTLLLDEADAVFKAREREDLRGLLNAGYRRGAVAYRMGGANKTKLEDFAVFCAKAFIGIGDFLPDTLVDRAIPIRLERRIHEEPIERFSHRDVAPEGAELRDRLADWLEPQLDYLAALRPDLPDALNDRARDSWEPLLAIADLAGGDWPKRARRAAVALSADEAQENDSLTALLLRDIHSVFSTNGIEAFRTADLLEQLHAIEESPWGEWYGKPLSSHGLSKLLRSHRIKTMSVYVGDGVSARGYKREQFVDAFARVLGVRSDRSDRNKSRSQEASNASNASNASTRNGRVATFGDADYLDYVAMVHRAGHITTGEALELEQADELILHGRAVKELGGDRR